MRGMAFLAAGVGLFFFLSFIPGPAEKVVFLDVGQGDSILWQNGTRQVLIDGGPGSTVLQRLGEELPWFDNRIEVVILTHPQRDHLEGLLHVLRRYEVGLIVFPEVPYSSQMYGVWLHEIQARQIPYRFAWAGQKITLGSLQFTILAPFDTPVAQAIGRSNVNNASTVTRTEFCSPTQECLSFLLTGDAEPRAENLLLAETPREMLKVDVLKAGHHGSRTSTTADLLAAARPSAAVISVGVRNQFGHPHPDVVQRLSGHPLWRTDRDGSVRFVLVKDRWIVQTQAQTRWP